MSVGACERPSKVDRCGRAVDHVFAVFAAEAKDEPAELARNMEPSRKAALATCRADSLSEPQLRCILGVASVDDLLVLGDCTAIRERMPAWLAVGAEP